MKRLTREWVSKAEADHVAATKLARQKPPLNDVVCFHCQQSVEKYLKALLQELGLPIAYTHDLEALFEQLLPEHPSLKPLRRGAAFLTDYAVDPRYPGKKSTKRQTSSSLRWETKFRDAARKLLGIRHLGNQRRKRLEPGQPLDQHPQP